MPGICLFGGGRWSKVLLGVLRSIVEDDVTIYWITKNNFESCNSWINSGSLKNIVLLREVDLRKTPVSAAIIATSPNSHFKYARETLALSIPTLCEKPLVLDIKEVETLERLARANCCPIGINLEFLFASYVQKFAKALAQKSIREITIFWHDPWEEQRYGEMKYGDIYTEITQDMLPHCWSILKTIAPDISLMKIDNVSYEKNSDVIVLGNSGPIKISFSLSRRSSRRIRKVFVNENEAILDFSEEPGTSTINGVTEKNTWDKRPLSLSLESFIQATNFKETISEWPLSLQNTMSSVYLASQCTELLNIAQKKLLLDLEKREGINLESPETLNLLVDMFIPKLALGGLRLPAHSPEDKNKFGQLWSNDFRKRFNI